MQLKQLAALELEKGVNLAISIKLEYFYYDVSELNQSGSVVGKDVIFIEFLCYLVHFV